MIWTIHSIKTFDVQALLVDSDLAKVCFDQEPLKAMPCEINQPNSIDILLSTQSFQSSLQAKK